MPLLVERSPFPFPSRSYSHVPSPLKRRCLFLPARGPPSPPTRRRPRTSAIFFLRRRRRPVGVERIIRAGAPFGRFVRVIRGKQRARAQPRVVGSCDAWAPSCMLRRSGGVPGGGPLSACAQELASAVARGIRNETGDPVNLTGAPVFSAFGDPRKRSCRLPRRHRCAALLSLVRSATKINWFAKICSLNSRVSWIPNSSPRFVRGPPA